jgi:hypothetical protein
MMTLRKSLLVFTIMIYSLKPLIIKTLSIVALRIVTLELITMTFRITKLSLTVKYNPPSISIEPLILNVVILCVFMLNVVAPFNHT